MELIVDANVLFSALIALNNKTAEILFSDEVTLYAPEYLLSELAEHKEEILEKSGLNEEDLEIFISLICTRIKLIDFMEFKRYIKEALTITPDEDDSEYLALALKLNCAVWSNDQKLKNQHKIKVITTSELVQMIRLD